MSLLLLIVMSFGLALGQVQVPCYGEGCVNATVYLGPRWGSKVIFFPRTTNKTQPEVGNIQGQVKILHSGDRYEEYDEKFRRPQHRPVPPGGALQVDFMDDEYSSRTTENPSRTTIRRPYLGDVPLFRWRTTTRRPTEYGRTVPTNRPSTGVQVVIDEYGRGSLDLSWRGYTGEEVKQALNSLPENHRWKVTKLNLDGNSIRDLPVLMFPVEPEYRLQQLSLSNNPINPPYLSSSTRFELSRLTSLKVLNISRCGLKSLELLCLPSLEVLDLSHNELTFLPRSMGRMDKLQQLLLRGNNMGYLSDLPLFSLSSLRVLDLGDNGLQEIWGQPLENLHSLVTLKLDQNRLKSLPILNSERTKVVSLGKNSLQCSCDLVQWVAHQNIQIQEENSERCTEPNSIRTITLRELRLQPDQLSFCQRNWWSEHWEFLARTYRLNSDLVAIIYKVVGVTLVVAVLAALFRRRKKLFGKVQPLDIPYDILDDQKVSVVSGPHCQAYKA